MQKIILKLSVIDKVDGIMELEHVLLNKVKHDVTRELKMCKQMVKGNCRYTKRWVVGYTSKSGWYFNK